VLEDIAVRPVPPAAAQAQLVEDVSAPFGECFAAILPLTIFMEVTGLATGLGNNEPVFKIAQ